jgi:hypothetical protein
MLSAKHGAVMVYTIKGTDKDGKMWKARADDMKTAEDLAELLRKDGYRNVVVRKLADA